MSEVRPPQRVRFAALRLTRDLRSDLPVLLSNAQQVALSTFPPGHPELFATFLDAAMGFAAS
jgi:hypothetical protein